VRNLFVSIGFSFCLAACSSAPVVFNDDIGQSMASGHGGNNPVLTGEEFKLAIGEDAPISDTGLSLVFETVAEDSRCAKGVVCVWEGNARARFRLRDGVHDEYIELNTSNRFESRHRIAPGILVMRGLDPQPPVPDSKRYVVTLVIEPGQ
jgi:hypothetical protein